MASELEVGKVVVGDSTNNHAWVTTKSTPGYYSGIKLTRGAGTFADANNNNFGLIVSDIGLSAAKFTSPGADVTGRTDFLTISSTGNVGINCDSPTVGQLQIDHASGSTLALTRTAGATTGTLGLVRFGNTDVDSNLANILVYQDNANDAAAIAFQTQPTGGSTATRVTIDSTGLATFSGGITVSGGITTLGSFTNLDVSSGAITVTSSTHRVDTESGAVSDDLDTINGGTDGSILVLRTNLASRDVTVKDGTGNLN